MAIARELHDVVAHSLTVISVQAGVGRRLAGRQPDQAETTLRTIEETARTAQEELGVVLGLLRDGDGRGADLAPAPGLADLEALAATMRASGTPVELHIAGADRQLSPALELTAYRIVQEALTNVAKHAPGPRPRCELAVTPQSVSIVVEDHGGTASQGASEPPSRPGSEHGIVGMRERVAAFGGSLRPRLCPTVAFASLPCCRSARLMIRVLVVDDQELLRTAFAALIEAEDDMEVVGQAAEGAEALRLASEHSPDVVVMDVRMPVMDGIEATRRIMASGGDGGPRVLISPPSISTSTSLRRWALGQAASCSRAVHPRNSSRRSV